MADATETTETTTEAGAATGAVEAPARPSLEELRSVLQTVQDPELRMSIVDLGLVYGIYIDDQGVVTIELTLTSPACPVGPMIQGQAYHLLTQMDGVEDVEVNLIWDPPWDPKTMASDEVKLMLGIW
jgi:metal-sulfur cluster biosynthetic enzyme